MCILVNDFFKKYLFIVQGVLSEWMYIMSPWDMQMQ